MAVCLALFFTVCSIVLAQDIITLSYPFEQEVVDSWGVRSTNGWRAFMNREINWGQYKNQVKYGTSGGWSNKMVNVVDGVEFNNFGQFQSYTMHLRNLFRRGSVTIPQPPITTIIDDRTLNVHFCVEMTLDISIPGVSRQINKCLDRKQYFDDNFVLMRSELTSDTGIAGTVFGYFLQSTITTILPDTADPFLSLNDNNNKSNGIKMLFKNPIILSILILIVSATLFIAIITGLIISTVQKQRNIKNDSVEDESDWENVPFNEM